MKIVDNYADFAKAIEKASAIFGDGVAESLKRGAAAAQAHARGHVHSNVAPTVKGHAERELFSLEVDHLAGWFIEAGTRAHVIEGRLAFQVAGQTVFARRVNHPGTAPKPYAKPGMEHGAQVFSASMSELFEKL